MTLTITKLRGYQKGLNSKPVVACMIAAVLAGISPWDARLTNPSNQLLRPQKSISGFQVIPHQRCTGPLERLPFGASSPRAQTATVQRAKSFVRAVSTKSSTPSSDSASCRWCSSALLGRPTDSNCDADT